MNNILQSEVVLAALDSTGRFTDTFWRNDHTFDIPYANGATLGPGSNTRSHYAVIEALTKSRPPATPTYVMDSRAALDLTGLGYQLRIADEWLIREESSAQLVPVPDNIAAEIIRTRTDLAAFERASVIGFGGEPSDASGHTYSPQLLTDDRFRFFGLHADGELAAGVMLFEDPRCIGVYTLFTLPDYRNRGFGTVVLEKALRRVPGKPIATNPSSMSRRIFERLGFRAAGERS
ncbi:hypothetical protein BH23CHL2_BH23CHL2_04540 [soil metagenome]